MKVNNLKISFDNYEILKNVNFNINPGDKVGLVGVNGCGKSTLLKVLSGELTIDSGKILFNNEIPVYLKQEIPIIYDDFKIIDYIKNQLGIDILEKKLVFLENNLNDNNMIEYGEILELYLTLDGYSFESNLNYILNGLHLNKSLESKISTLSGGERIKILLSIMLLSKGDILLLDEPTNNLDIEAITWLEKYLFDSKKSIIMVSHDEIFLNNIVKKVYELSNGVVKEYNLNYNDYCKQIEMEYEKNKISYENAIEERKKLKERLQKTKEWSSKGNSSRAHNDNDKIANNFAKEKTNSSDISKISRNLEKLNIPEFDEKKKINFCFDFDNDKGNKDIRIEKLICGYNDFKTASYDLNINYGDKVNLNGPNGSGKTTLVKTLLNEIPPIQGNVFFGTETKVGYISQNTLINDIDITVFDYLCDNINETNNSLVFTLLNNFGFDYDDRNKKYSELSPGQRTRVNLTKIALSKINVLILDEITNHLDKEALDLIYELVENFPGTIISISHNRKYNDILNPDYELDIISGNIEYLKNTIHKSK